jgi:hypothetical protein
MPRCKTPHLTKIKMSRDLLGRLSAMLQRQATRYLSRVVTDAWARQVNDPEEQRRLKMYVVGFAFSESDSVSDANGISPFRQDTALQLIFEAIDLERGENDDEYLTLSDLSMCLAMPLPVLWNSGSFCSHHGGRQCTDLGL